MARRVFLHIGVMKSATSSLQRLCEQNQDQLAAAGLFWCPDEVRYQVVKDGLGKTDEPAAPGEGWSGLIERIQQHQGDVLLSNELLAGLGISQIKRLLRGLTEDVRIVLTARDLSRIIPSHWQTTIKNGKTWTWAEFSTAVCAGPEGDGTSDAYSWFWRRHDLPLIISRWTSVVPVDRISVVTVPAGVDSLESIASRFGSVVGVGLASMEQPDTRQNPSLGAHSVELLRRINASMTESPFDDPDHRYERALGGALAAHAHLEPPFALSQDQLRWLRERAETMVAEVERLGISVVGDLTDLVPDPERPKDAVDPGDAGDADLLRAAARGLVNLAPVFNGLRLDRNDLRIRLKTSQAGSDEPGTSATTTGHPGGSA